MTQENYSLKVSDRCFLEALQRSNLQNKPPSQFLSPKQAIIERQTEYLKQMLDRSSKQEDDEQTMVLKYMKRLPEASLDINYGNIIEEPKNSMVQKQQIINFKK